MRKLRNLWSSHKKYCTTTIAPYRSYTPLSGYPSSSSYDLDRTYLTSTPYKVYNNRFKRNNGLSKFSDQDEIGNLSNDLSDLSIDKISDTDDDHVKVRIEKAINKVAPSILFIFCFVYTDFRFLLARS